ncbi:MAG: PAS domain-containing sensor histidine kinase [Pirellulales bacterium]
MHDFKAKLLWAAPALAASLLAGLTWAAGSSLGGWSWLALIAWFVLGGVAAGGPLAVVCRRMQHQQQTARNYLERLSRLEHHQLAPDAPCELGPALHEGHLWARLLNQIRDNLATQAARLAEAEHARAALEIRARRHAAEAERASKILCGLPEPVLAVGAYDELLLANPSAARLFDFDPSACGRQALGGVVHCEKLLALLNDTRRRKSPLPRSEELELDGPDGAARWYSVCTSALPLDGDGARPASDAGYGAVAVLRDVSSQKRVQRTNAEFVSAASHEMKTPLAGIKAYVELLADGDAQDEATREEFLQVINGQADRLERLIDNLLNLARIEAGVVKVSKQSQPLNEILCEAVRVVQPSAEAKRIELSHELSPLYLGVLADRDMLLQAAMNLLSNAVKYTPPGGSVVLRSRLVDRDVQFEVEDTGVGLSSEDCQRVFDKFYRVDKDKQMASGTGLGLPLAKYIIEDVHNGRLTVESQLGAGSTFQVTLPGSGQLNSKQERRA